MKILLNKNSIAEGDLVTQYREEVQEEEGNVVRRGFAEKAIKGGVVINLTDEFILF